jgi:hypothetical protein
MASTDEIQLKKLATALMLLYSAAIGMTIY